MAVRDVLRKHGVPPTWITANPQSAFTARRERGVHLHLMIREWHPQLLAYVVALERQVRSRVVRLDPFSAEWLTGISWKFDLVDDARCPAMPPAGFWENYLARRRPAAAQTAVTPASPLPSPEDAMRVAPAARLAEPAFMPTQPMAPQR